MPDIENVSEVEAGSVDENVITESLGPTDNLFDDLSAQYYKAWFRFHPERAVDAGVYDYADQLRSYEHDDIGALIVLNQKMQSALDELNFSDLDQSRQLDYRILEGAISIELHDLEENDWRYRDPVAYVPVTAIYQLLIHPGDNVHASIKRRLDAIPEYLRGAKVMLAQYPERVVPQWAEMARHLARAGADLIRAQGRNPLLTAMFTNPSKLQPLCEAAAIALSDFSAYLENEVQPRAAGKFASGHNRFKRLLNDKHNLASDADKVLAFGDRLAAQTEQELLQLSEKICGQQDIMKALDMVRSNHPERSQLLDSYRSKMHQAHDWLRQADIVTLPEKLSLKVQQTPAFFQGLFSFAAYQPPMPNDKEQRGIFYVSMVEDEALLAEHNQYSSELTSVHEAYPGHHVQFVIANQSHSHNVTRLLNASASLYEGWSLYCEQLAFEQGLYDQKEHEFILLRNRLWRALRIIIDVKIHTGQYSFDDAVALLIDKLGLDHSQAQDEISCCSRAAATPLCSAVGREIILKTREILGVQDKAKLKAFHDELLSQGSIALPLVVQTVFGESVWQKVHDEIFNG